jgi:hypothetical protein
MMTAIEQTGFSSDWKPRAASSTRLLKAPTKAAGRFGFRGDLALKFADKLADEARPPELAVQQVMAVAVSPAIPPSRSSLRTCCRSSTCSRSPKCSGTEPDVRTGRYFVFCNNIDISTKYRVVMDDIPFYVLPIDEATVYNELLELLYIERNDLKKLDTAGKARCDRRQGGSSSRLPSRNHLRGGAEAHGSGAQPERKPPGIAMPTLGMS